MPFKRTRSNLILTEKEKEILNKLKLSRTEAHEKVQRAKILLDYEQGIAINRIAKQLGVSRPNVERCIDKALSGGIELSLADLPRSGRPAIISADDKAWVINLACKKPKEIGYAQETWTISLLSSHVRTQASIVGHPALGKASKSLIHSILKELPVRPHKIQYYLERRDSDFENKMAQVLMVYKQVQLVNEKGKKGKKKQKWIVVSYDEKPGIQAIENIAKDLLPVAGKYSTLARDAEYKRHGTVSLLAGIDLHDGTVIPLVRERHRSSEFIEFLELLHAHYPPKLKLRIILDNHSAHISKQTVSWLKQYPNRFEFIFTPKHGSWLNLIEMFFSKMTRSFLRYLRVSSKAELIKRILLYIDEVNAAPVVFRWKYKMDDLQLS